jgi:hypothetical protein
MDHIAHAVNRKLSRLRSSAKHVPNLPLCHCAGEKVNICMCFVFIFYFGWINYFSTLETYSYINWHQKDD